MLVNEAGLGLYPQSEKRYGPTECQKLDGKKHDPPVEYPVPESELKMATEELGGTWSRYTDRMMTSGMRSE